MPRCSYLAVLGETKDALLERLGLVEGELADPDDFNPLQVCQLPSGWLILVTTNISWASEKRARSASQNGALAIGTYYTTVVMGAEAYAYQGGELKWRLLHDPDHKTPLEITGNPPPELAGIHADLTKLQSEDEAANVDYIFEAPMALGAALHGYRPDEDIADPQPVFRLVKSIGGRRGGLGWLRGFFGARNVR